MFTARMVWKELLEPIVARYEKKRARKYFRADAIFAKPDIYEYLEKKGFLYAIQFSANEVIQEERSVDSRLE